MKKVERLCRPRHSFDPNAGNSIAGRPRKLKRKEGVSVSLRETRGSPEDYLGAFTVAAAPASSLLTATSSKFSLSAAATATAVFSSFSLSYSSTYSFYLHRSSCRLLSRHRSRHFILIPSPRGLLSSSSSTSASAESFFSRSKTFSQLYGVKQMGLRNVHIFYTWHKQAPSKMRTYQCHTLQ